MGDKTKDQLIKELSEVQKMLEERTEAQGRMIRRFQMLMANDSLFSQIIDFFPYPIAIFTPQYTLFLVNKAFTAETKIRLTMAENKVVRILQYKTDDMQLAAAITSVFSGKTSILESLKSPFSIFSEFKQQNGPQPGRFTKAVIFPVSADDAAISHGVIVFMP
jgi:hypothetical protein